MLQPTSSPVAGAVARGVRRAGRLYLSLRALAALLACALAHADDSLPGEPPPTFLMVGPAVDLTPAYPGDRAQRTFALPDVEAQYDNWLYISGLDLLGVYAWNRNGSKAGGAIEYDVTERLSKDSPHLERLDDVRPTARFKLFATQRVAMFSGGIDVAPDIAGRDEGTVAHAHVELLLPLTARGYFTIGPGVTWSDRGYMRAFYGVSAQQSALSGLPQYTAHPGISDVYGEAVAGYQLSSRWSVGLDVTCAHLENSAARSPFTESVRQTTWLGSLLYKFK
jgi:MipA family protein